MFPGWQFLLRLLGRHHDRAHTLVSDDDDDDLDLHEAPDAPDVEIEPIVVTPLESTRLIETVGAWCGSSSLRNPKRDVAFAKSVGINQLHIIVNDFSARRTRSRFTVRNREQLIRLANECHKAEIEVCIMSWLQPYEAHIREAAEILIPLTDEMGSTLLVWDLEEPWNLSKNGMGYRKAGALVGELFAGVRMGITGIRYAPTSKLRPVAEHCEIKIPQAYSTSTSKASPHTVAHKGHKKWSKDYGPKVVPGLAAYRQRGIRVGVKRKLLSQSEAIHAAAAGAAKLGTWVVYWGLNSIRKSPEIAKAIAEVCGRTETEENTNA